MDSIKTNDIHNAEAEIPPLFQAQCASSKPGSYIAMQQLLSDTTGGNLSDAASSGDTLGVILALSHMQ